MNPKPNRESRMKKRALPTDLQTTDLVGTSKMRGNDEEGQGEEKRERKRQRKQREGESLPDSGQNATLGQDGDSRDSLGTHSGTVVRTSLEEASHAGVEGPILLMFQLPVEELDRLQVEVSSRPFYALTPATMSSVIDAMDRQEEMHLRGETRQRANQIMAYALAGLEGSFSVYEMQARVRRAAELREGLLAGSLELEHLEGRQIVNAMDLGSYTSRDGLVVRLNSMQLMPSGDQLENQLIQFPADVDRLAAFVSKGTIEDTWFEFVPQSMSVVRFSDDGNNLRVHPIRQSCTYGRYRAFFVRRIPT